MAIVNVYRKSDSRHLLDLYTSESGIRLTSKGFVQSDVNKWKNIGNITSIVDLVGSLMIITRSMGAFHPSMVQKSDSRRMLFKFPTLKIKLARGNILNIGSSNIMTFRVKNSGYVVHWFQFPNSLEKLMDLVINCQIVRYNQLQ